MKAKELEKLLSRLSQKRASEMVDRFQNLRNTTLLPKERGRHARELMDAEIIYGILAAAASKSSNAGLHARTLGGLKSVGGKKASYKGAEFLKDAIMHLLNDLNTKVQSISLLITDGDTKPTNSSGYAEITYVENGKTKTLYFVNRLALTLFTSGQEKRFKRSSYVREITSWIEYSADFFSELKKAH